MADKTNVITCPHCKREIPLDEVLTHQIKEKFQKEFNEQISRKERELRVKEDALITKEKELQRVRAEQAKEIEKVREKLEMLYDYLSGIEFRQQIEGIVESFVAMKKDLDAERRAMEKIWAKREKQIEKVVKNTGRMYGSLQGIVGSTLPELKTLELKALEK